MLFDEPVTLPKPLVKAELNDYHLLLQFYYIILWSSLLQIGAHIEDNDEQKLKSTTQWIQSAGSIHAKYLLTSGLFSQCHVDFLICTEQNINNQNLTCLTTLCSCFLLS